MYKKVRRLETKGSILEGTSNMLNTSAEEKLYEFWANWRHVQENLWWVLNARRVGGGGESISIHICQMQIIKSALQLTKQNLMFINCYFLDADNEDIGTTHSVQQQNLFNVSNVLILRVTS